MNISRSLVVMITLVATLCASIGRPVLAIDLSEQEVKLAIDRGKKYLVNEQAQNGSWSVDGLTDVRAGITSLCVLALLNSGMSPQDPPARRGLQFLRSLTVDDLSGKAETYQVSLVIMALAAAREPTDGVRIATFAQRLEQGQRTNGNVGSWSYGVNGLSDSLGDQSNTQFAILGLREAVEAGASVNPQTWNRARDYWERNQNHDGGWGYSQGFNGELAPSRGSMTVAGVASLAIIQQMLKSDQGVSADGTT